MRTSNMTFGEALEHLKGTLRHGSQYQVTRKAWKGTNAAPVVRLQVPDEDSKMTEPYLYIEKYNAHGKRVRFPLDLSGESVLAEDWEIII